MWFLVIFCDFRPIFPTFVAILRHFWPFCLFFRHTLWNSWLILPRGSNFVNNFGDSNYILAISLQFSAVFLCFLTGFLHFGHFLGDSSQLFAYFSRFKDQFNWTNNHMQIRIIFQEYIKCHFRHFYLFIHPRERSERGCTKSYRGLVAHFCLVNDHFLIARRSSPQILVFSPRSKFGGAKRLARTGREDGRKKNWRFFFQRPAF